MYIPDTRNTLTSNQNIKGMPQNLFSFYEEWMNANDNLKGKRLKLPINNYEYRYDKSKGSSFIIGSDYEIDLKNASSGAQTITPLYLVSKYLSNIVLLPDELQRDVTLDKYFYQLGKELNAIEFLNLSVSEKESKRKEVRSKYLSKCFINIVEEPEQNLFPKSQQNTLNSLLEFNNLNEGNKLIMTTHSPYILSYLTMAIKGKLVLDKIKKDKSKDKLEKKLNKIIPLKSLISPDDVAIYQIDDEGNIIKLNHYKGLPSDDNYLNNGLEIANDLFSQLLDLEDLCQ